MLENFGEKMTFDEIEEFLAIADKNGDGIIDYGGKVKYVLTNN